MNFLLFVPYGFLLPLVFTASKWNWEKILCIGALTSLIIELLQMFGGRYAEIDDLLMNTIGTLTGYLINSSILELRRNKKKVICLLLALFSVLAICFSEIYYLCDNSENVPDGFAAVENEISKIHIYCNGEIDIRHLLYPTIKRLIYIMLGRHYISTD